MFLRQEPGLDTLYGSADQAFLHRDLDELMARGEPTKRACHFMWQISY
jgi:hypothetical protein